MTKKKPSTAANSLQIIDWEACLFIAGGKVELAKMLLDMFVTALPPALEIINLHHQSKAWKKLCDELHKLLGSCCYAGSAQLKEIVKKTESAIKAKADVAVIAEMMTQLNNEANQFLVYYQQNKQFHVMTS